MADGSMFVSYAYNAAGNAHPGFGNTVLPAIPPIKEEDDVDFWLEKQIKDVLAETWPDLEGINVVILYWRRLED